jgi:error-prone DNA polymerase
VRTEPLLLAEGTLERLPAAGGAINVLVHRIGPIDVPDRPLAEVKDFHPLEEVVTERDARSSEEEQQAADFRAVAPAVLSFAAGRRR